MEKRVLLAVVLCIVTYLVWFRIFPPPMPAPTTQQAGPATISAPAGQGTPTPAPMPTPANDQAASAQPQLPPETTEVIERPGLYRAVVTSYGAALKSYELLNKKYYTTDLRRLVLKEGATQPSIDRRQTDGPMDLITSYRPSGVVGLKGGGYTLPPIQAFTLVSREERSNGDHKLIYRWESPEVRLEKTLIFSATTFQIMMTVVVTNLKAAPVSHSFEVDLEGVQDPSQKPGGMFSARVPQNTALWDRAGKMQSANLEALQQESVATDKLKGDIRWIAVGQQYFLLAAALQYGKWVQGEKQGHARADANGAISISAEYSERTLKHQASTSYQATLYAGPKLPELLDGVKVAGNDDGGAACKAAADCPSDQECDTGHCKVSSGLKTSIDYTLEFLARPLLWILRQVHRLVHSWALAIVILTMLVKLVTLYPSHRSMKSMKAMGALKPEIDALKLKYPDKQRFNQELMALYKKNNVNPIGGCLPMVIQMPIYFALYSMLGTAVELYRAQFFWIRDLTAADPFFILPVVTGGLMFLQTKVSPAPTDPQQKMMANMMPVMFTFVSVFLPAGLTLYIMTNTMLGMLQQFVINRGGLKVLTAATK